MRREMDGLLGTEWQPSDLLGNLYSDSSVGIGNKIREIRLWLSDFEGEGSYYLDPIFNQVYFECDGDRMVFLLRWA